MSSEKTYFGLPQVQPQPERFIETTARYVLYNIAAATLSAFGAIALGMPPFAQPIVAIAVLGSGYMVRYYTKQACIHEEDGSFADVQSNYSSAFFFMLALSGTTGLLVAPWLASVVATTPQGMAIILAALAITTIQAAALCCYAWYTDRNLTVYGSFLSSALVGLLVLSLINMFVPTPVGMLLHGLCGVLAFSGWLAYDFYKLRTKQFTSPILAASNLYLDLLNLFVHLVELFAALKSDKKTGLGASLSKIFFHFVLPMLGVFAIALSFGLLEEYVFGKASGVDAGQGSSPENDREPGEPSGERVSQAPRATMFGAGAAEFPQEGLGGSRASYPPKVGQVPQYQTGGHSANDGSQPMEYYAEPVRYGGN